MGWWKIRNVETGQVNFDAVTAAPGALANAVPGKDDPGADYGGDDPADMMGATLRSISKTWELAWGRPAKPEELRACFNFCLNGLVREREEQN